MRKITGTLLAAFAIMLGACSGPKERQVEPVPQPPSYTQLRQLGQITFAEMTVTKTGTIEDLTMSNARGVKEKAHALLNSLKIGDRKGAYSYDTFLRAYIDLADLTDDAVSVDTAARTVALYLPPIRTEMAGRDATLREEHYRVTGLRSNISPSERAALKEQMNAMLRKEIASNADFEKALRQKARQRAVQYFDSLFATRGYSVDIRFKNDMANAQNF